MHESGSRERWLSGLRTHSPNTTLRVDITKLGETEQALDLLEHSLRNAPPEMIRWVKHDADLDNLRNHPRYQEILELIEQT